MVVVWWDVGGMGRVIRDIHRVGARGDIVYYIRNTNAWQ